MSKDYYKSYIEFLKYLYKYNRVMKASAEYFLNKYLKKKAQGINVTVEDL